MSNIMDYVGERTITKMETTKLYAFARALADVLYSADVVASKSTGEGCYWKPEPSTEKTPDGEKKFCVGLHVYVGKRVPMAVGKEFLAGHENQYVDVRKLLSEMMHECERLALKEVT